MTSGTHPIDASQLARLLAAADPRVIWLPARIMRRVIKADRELGGFGLHVPHQECYVIARERFWELVERDEVEVGRDEGRWVLAIAHPDPEELPRQPVSESLLWGWRRLLHATIDALFADRLAAHELTPAALRARVHEVGQTEFDAIRALLRDEDRLLPPLTTAQLYTEFVALYCELRHFEPDALERIFPRAGNRARIDATLQQDLDLRALVDQTRPEGAPSPDRLHHLAPRRPAPPPLPPARQVSPEQERRLAARARRARKRGNAVRALLLWSQIAAGAPEARRALAQGRAEEALGELVTRVVAAWGEGGPTAAQWREALSPLMALSVRGVAAPEARLLYDLQKACLECERESYKLDLAGWVASRGALPAVRALTEQRYVLALRHLRRSLERLPTLRLDQAQHARLEQTLRCELEADEHILRRRLDPLLAAAFAEVGPTPRSLPERAARAKLRAELIDQIIERGFMGIGHLRDALSRNALKLADVTGPRSFWSEDALLNLNRRIGDDLPGLYRRGELYMRLLQRLNAVGFGTRVGRAVSLYLALPFGLAFVLLEGLQHIVHPLTAALGAEAIHLNTTPRLIATGLAALTLIHSPATRRAVWRGLSAVGSALRWVLWDAPRWVLRRGWVQAALHSAPVRLTWRYVLRPLLISAVLWAALPLLGVPLREALLLGAGLFVFTNVLVNSRLGQALEERVGDAVATSWHRLTTRILPGLFRWVMDFFKRAVDRLERLLYLVDEWLRFRRDNTRAVVALKLGLGLVWSALVYLFRLCVNLLVEPQLNPIKHFPVVTVSHKVLLSMAPSVHGVLTSVLGAPAANAITGPLIFGTPGVFGFLVWELRENWRLYRANRPPTLVAAPIGHHGETMARLMKPGFHSGTLPKLYARLRRAERKGRRRSVNRTRALHKELHHVGEDVRRFVEREALLLVERQGVLEGLRVSHVRTGSNRIEVGLAWGDAAEALEIAFVEQSGWLLGSVTPAPWVERLTGEQRQVLRNTIAGLYAVSGVELAQAQIAACLPPGATWDVHDGSLVVWPDQGYKTEVTYRLFEDRLLHPAHVTSSGAEVASAPVLDPDRLFITRSPITWERWVRFWDGDLSVELMPGLRLLPTPSPERPNPATLVEPREGG